jgi:hypothetical protein
VDRYLIAAKLEETDDNDPVAVIIEERSFKVVYQVYDTEEKRYVPPPPTKDIQKVSIACNKFNDADKKAALEENGGRRRRRPTPLR